jgi:hypothetical protein
MTYESFGFLPYGGTKCKFSFFLSFPRPPATLCVAMRAGKRESRNFKLYIVILNFDF